MLRQADADVIVVASDAWTTTPSSEVLRTSNGSSVLHAPVRLAAALATRGTFDGALSSEPTVTFYDARGIAEWSSSGGSSHRGSMRAVRSGSNIVLALYSPIATGAELVAHDEATGALAWQGDVDSLPIGHSKYSNKVALHSRGGFVILRGQESAQDYVQTFDATTGTRTASILRRRP